jgi:hypothetical protein
VAIATNRRRTSPPLWIASAVQHLLYRIDPVRTVHVNQVVLKDIHLELMLEDKHLLPPLPGEHPQTFSTGIPIIFGDQPEQFPMQTGHERAQTAIFGVKI